MEKKYYEINERLAKSAKMMWSFSDYIENSTTNEYRKEVDKVFALGEKAIAKGVDADRVQYYCDRFARQLAEWHNTANSIEMMCPSVMIAGASNFPVRKKEKQNARRESHNELHKKIYGVFDKLHSMINGTEIIKSNDEFAIEKLQDKLEKLLVTQTYMKELNKYYRKNKTCVGFEDMPEETALKYDADVERAFSWEKQPFPSYELTSINSKIKRINQRINELSTVKERGTTEAENDICKVVENTEIMRLQLIFDGKPDDATREILKRNGFKWSPKNTAWQRQLTDNARYSAKKVLKALAEK